MGAPVGNFNALKHGKQSPRKRAERLAAWRAEWKERELADLAWSATNRPTDYSKILDDGGEERFMQQIRVCTHDGTGAKPVIRARLLVRILFSASVSQRASLILSQKMNRASTPITVLPLVQQEGD